MQYLTPWQDPTKAPSTPSPVESQIGYDRSDYNFYEYYDDGKSSFGDSRWDSDVPVDDFGDFDDLADYGNVDLTEMDMELGMADSEPQDNIGTVDMTVTGQTVRNSICLCCGESDHASKKRTLFVGNKVRDRV